MTKRSDLRQRRTAAFAEPALDQRTSIVTTALISLVVLSAFFGRFDIPVLGFNVRLEQIFPVVLAVWMLVVPALRMPFLRTLRHPVVLVYAIFVAWNILSTLIFSPDYGWSVSIVAWLAIDLLILMSIMTLKSGAELSFRILVAAVVPWALAGMIVFLLANLTNGAFNFGVAFDWLYEIYVARVTAIEANIFASILMVCGLLAITRRGLPWWWVTVLCITIPLGLLASQTRTAVFSLAGGAVVFIIASLFRRGQKANEWIRRVAPAVSLVITLALFYTIVSAVQSQPTASPAAPDPTTEPVAVAAMSPANDDAAAVEQSVEHPTATSAITATPPVSPEPTPSPTRNVPDPSNPDTQNKLGDFSVEGGTVGFRMKIIEMALDNLHGANLWFGNGTNTFGITHIQPDTPGNVSGHIIILPVQVLYDAGIVGLALLVALFVTAFAYTPAPRKPVAAGVLAAFLVSATMTSFFWFAITWLMFAVLLRPADGDDVVKPIAFPRRKEARA
ncbi:MAG: O-antigen ligase family protein [Pseudoclavibacter sp.]